MDSRQTARVYGPCEDRRCVYGNTRICRELCAGLEKVFRVFDVVVNDVVCASNVDVWKMESSLLKPILIEYNSAVPVNSTVTVNIIPKM